MHVDAAQSIGTWEPIWNWFGYDEPNYTYMPHGKKLLRQLAELHAHHRFGLCLGHEVAGLPANFAPNSISQQSSRIWLGSLDRSLPLLLPRRFYRR